MTSGQVCYAPKRLYVHRSLRPVRRCFTAAAAGIRVGDGLDPAVTMGPLNNRAQYDTVHAARSLPAERKARTSSRSGSSSEQTVATAISSGRPLSPGCSRIWPLVQQEQFGPALPFSLSTRKRRWSGWRTTAKRPGGLGLVPGRRPRLLGGPRIQAVRSSSTSTRSAPPPHRSVGRIQAEWHRPWARRTPLTRPWNFGSRRPHRRAVDIRRPPSPLLPVERTGP